MLYCSEYDQIVWLISLTETVFRKLALKLVHLPTLSWPCTRPARKACLPRRLTPDLATCMTLFEYLVRALHEKPSRTGIRGGHVGFDP